MGCRTCTGGRPRQVRPTRTVFPSAGESPLDGFFDAVAGIGEDPVDVVIYGDSITMGRQSVALDGYYGGWPTLMADGLTGIWGPNETHGPGWVPCRLVNDAEWTLTNTSTLSGPSLVAGLGLWGVNLYPGDELTLPADAMFSHDAIGVRFTAFSSLSGVLTPASIEVEVGGNVIDTISTLDSEIPANQWVSHRGEDFDLSTLDEREIVLRASGESGQVAVVDGVFLYRGNQSAGLRVWNAGHSGYRYTHLFASPACFDAVEALQPALVIGAHFWGGQVVSLSQYATNLDTFIDEILDRSPDSSIILSAQYETATWVAGKYQDMVAVTKQVAAERGVYYLDPGVWTGQLGSAGVRTDPCELLDDDNVHPSAAGLEALSLIWGATLLNIPPTPQCDLDPVPEVGWLAVDWWAAGRAEDLADAGDGQTGPESWFDVSGNGRSPTQSNASLRPVYDESVAALNGLPGAVFTGTEYYRVAGVALNQPFSGVIVDVVASGSVDYQGRTLGFNTANAAIGVGTGPAGDGCHRLVAGSALDSTATPTADQVRILEFYCNGADSWIRVNDEEVASGNAGTTAINQLVVGAGFSATPSANFVGTVGLWAIYAGLHHDDPNWEEAKADLFDRYGVEL